MHDIQAQACQNSEDDEVHRLWEQTARAEFTLAISNRLPHDVGQSQPKNMSASALEIQQAQTERLVVIGLRVADFSHECRNEMVILKTSLELLEGLLPKEPDALEVICRMKDSEIRLHRLFDDIRGYAGPVHLDLAEEQVLRVLAAGLAEP